MSACVTESSIFETTWLQRNPSGNQPFQQPKLLGFLGVLHFRWCFDHVPKKNGIPFSHNSHTRGMLPPPSCFKYYVQHAPPKKISSSYTVAIFILLGASRYLPQDYPPTIGDWAAEKPQKDGIWQFPMPSFWENTPTT